MRKLSFIALFLLFLSACTKSGGTSGNNNTSVTCTANGKNYSFPVAYFEVHSSTTGSKYWCFTALDVSGNALALAALNTVNIGTMSSAGTSEANFEGIHYVDTKNRLSITVNNVHDGKADGTFSVVLDKYNSPTTGSISVTQGVFKNVLIQQ